MHQTVATVDRARRGFTLVEILFAVTIVGVLIGLLVVGLTIGRRSASNSLGAVTVNAMKIGAAEFTRECNIQIPLIKDYQIDKAVTGERIYPVYLPSPLTGDDAKALRHEDGTPKDDPQRSPPAGWGGATEYWDRRFSVAALPVYLAGVDETPLFTGAKIPVDGVPGPGIAKPNEDGSFQIPENAKKPNATVKRVGQTFGPYLDTTKGGAKVTRGGTKGERFEIHDAKGVAYRYYRWLQGNPKSNPPYQVKTTADLNVPKVVGDAEKNPALRGSTAAIVWCGADGLYGDEPKSDISAKLGLPVSTDAEERLARDQAISDNVVEVVGS